MWVVLLKRTNRGPLQQGGKHVPRWGCPRLPREHLLYFNFEDERLAAMTSDQLGLVIEEYDRLHPEVRHGGRAVLFLDEVQIVSG